MKNLAFVILTALLALSCASEARPVHGGVALNPSSCDVNYPDDGCSGHNPNATYQLSTFYDTVRQTGQAPYVARAPWKVAGVDYPVGAEPDATLIDATVSPPAGCTVVAASHWLRCGSGVTLSGYKFYGYGIYADVAPLIIDNSHFTVTADNCRNYQGTGLVSTHGGTDVIRVTNSTFEFTAECTFNADLYKTASDPGFPDLSSGTASFSGTALTYSGTPTGTVRVGSYIACAGCVKAMIVSGSGLNWIVSASQGTLGPVTVTTGPVAASMNGPIASGSTGNVTLYYNWNIGSGQFSSAVTGVDAKYNFEEINTQNLQHVNFIFNGPPAAPTTVNFTMDHNTIWWSPYAEDSGTGTLDLFTSSANASDFGPFVVDNFSVQGNTVVANKSIPQGNTKNTNALVRFLGQKGSGPDTLYAMSGGNLTLTYMDGGSTPTQINPNPTKDLGSVIQCTTCTVPVQFNSQTSGTAGGLGVYAVSNTVDTVTQLTASLPAYRMLSFGSGYTTATVSISGGGGSGAAANANIVNGGIVSYNVTNGGSGYTIAPNVIITDGTGTGASAKATISGGAVVSIAVTATGQNYVSPSISFTGGGGSGAVASATTANGIISSVTQGASAGSGYTSRPTVTITGDGTGAVAQAVLNATQTRRVSNYNGTINTTNVNKNYFDAIGADGPYNFDLGNTWLGTVNSTANVNMSTGNSCNWGGTCN